MEEPYHEDDATCRFQVINLVMVGGSDVHLLPIHQAMCDSYHENANFSLMEALLKQQCHVLVPNHHISLNLYWECPFAVATALSGRFLSTGR